MYGHLPVGLPKQRKHVLKHTIEMKFTKTTTEFKHFHFSNKINLT